MNKVIPFLFTNRKKEFTYKQLKNIYEDSYIKVSKTQSFIKRLFKNINIDFSSFNCVIDIWTGGYYFHFIVKDKETKEHYIALRLTYNKEFEYFELIDIYNHENKLNIDNNIIKDNYNKYIKSIYNKLLKISNLDEKYSVVKVEFYNDYKLKNTIDISGSLYNIFHDYSGMNDKLKYINGSYYKFANENVTNVYRFYIKEIEKNHFLKNMLKRGVIID